MDGTTLGPKRLYRIPSEGMLAGVCAGIAEYADVDKTLVRVLYALLTIFTALVGGILAYVVMWVILPPKPGTELPRTEATTPPQQR